MTPLSAGDVGALPPLAPIAAATYTETSVQWFFMPFRDR